MRKYGVLLLVVVLAVCGLAAAAAYNSATVVSTQTLKIVNTNEALLALIPGPAGSTGNKDLTANVVDGSLEIKFGVSGVKNNDGSFKNGFPGLQPDSIYQWDQLISIWNKSAENLNVTVTVDSAIAPYLTIKGIHASNQWYDDVPVFGNSRSYTFGLGADYTIPLTFIIDLPGNISLATLNGQITVTAVAK